MTKSINNSVLSRIYEMKMGWVFTAAHFLDIGSRSAVAKALERLVEAGSIRRLARGLYDYPEKHAVLGDLPANYERIAQALAGRDNLKIQPSGAYAANLLGLTDQVSAKIIFLTDGHSRVVQVNDQRIVLKRTTPKNMATAGRISGLIIQALRHLGQDNTDERVVKKLQRKLTVGDKKQLMDDIRYAPAWIEKIFRQLRSENT